MSQDITRRCIECRWVAANTGFPVETTECIIRLTCRKRAPNPEFAIVHQEDFCGEFEPANGESETYRQHKLRMSRQ